MQFIDLGSQYNHLKSRIDNRIQGVLSRGDYIMGAEVRDFEESLADFVGVKHAITCANGTDALLLSYMALGIKPGDAVFCPTFTFFATAETIAQSGATPVFVDVDEKTYNICVADLERQIQKTISEGSLIPKGIVPVDLFGLPADYHEIKKIAQKYNLLIVEDAAQGLGGGIGDEKSGSFGDIATTSFFPAKPLGCYGDGGAVLTDSDEYAELLNSFRVHGKGSDKYDNVRIGMNSRLDTMQAAILIEKLLEFPSELDKRDNVAFQFYESKLKSSFNTPVVPAHFRSSWAQYTIAHENRDEIIGKLKSENIPAMVYYRKCMHQQTAFKSLGYLAGDFPVAEKLAKEVFSLPMHPYLSDKEASKITELLITL